MYLQLPIERKEMKEGGKGRKKNRGREGGKENHHQTLALGHSSVFWSIVLVMDFSSSFWWIWKPPAEAVKKGRVSKMHIWISEMLWQQVGSADARDARDSGSIPGSGRSSGVGNGNPLQYSCLENSMNRGAWRATDHRVAKSWTQLHNWMTEHPSISRNKQTATPTKKNLSYMIKIYGLYNEKSKNGYIDFVTQWCH